LKFAIDGMLGKLARWLRMLGYDVAYSNSKGDDELLLIARSEHRVLLTRDFALYQQAIGKQIESFYVEGRTEPERLAELSESFQISLEIDMQTSRCPKCNSQLKIIAKQDTAGRVERNTFENYSEFWECVGCGQIYWQGAHWTKIKDTLSKAKGTKNPK
jgi:uncharacterized protein with PIN domain